VSVRSIYHVMTSAVETMESRAVAKSLIAPLKAPPPNPGALRGIHESGGTPDHRPRIILIFVIALALPALGMRGGCFSSGTR
jgi:hypothetical protein